METPSAEFEKLQKLMEWRVAGLADSLEFKFTKRDLLNMLED